MNDSLNVQHQIFINNQKSDQDQSSNDNIIQEKCSHVTPAYTEIETRKEVNNKVLNYNNVCTTLSQQKNEYGLTNQQHLNVESNLIFIFNLYNFILVTTKKF